MKKEEEKKNKEELQMKKYEKKRKSIYMGSRPVPNLWTILFTTIGLQPPAYMLTAPSRLPSTNADSS